MSEILKHKLLAAETALKKALQERDEAKILAEYLFGPEEMAAERQLRIAAEAERDEARRIEAAADSTYTHWRDRATAAEADREALRMALEQAETVLMMVEPRNHKAEYMEALDVVRGALARTGGA